MTQISSTRDRSIKSRSIDILQLSCIATAIISQSLVFHLAVDQALELPEVKDVVRVFELGGSKLGVPANIAELDVENVFSFTLRRSGKGAFLIKPDRPYLSVQGEVGCLVAHLAINLAECYHSFLLNRQGSFHSRLAVDPTDLICNWAIRDSCRPSRCKRSHSIFSYVV